jgi:hypothetical protein
MYARFVPLDPLIVAPTPAWLIVEVGAFASASFCWIMHVYLESAGQRKM